MHTYQLEDISKNQSITLRGTYTLPSLFGAINRIIEAEYDNADIDYPETFFKFGRLSGQNLLIRSLFSGESVIDDTHSLYCGVIPSIDFLNNIIEFFTEMINLCETQINTDRVEYHFQFYDQDEIDQAVTDSVKWLPVFNAWLTALLNYI